jgi:tRNA/tmRNA/rRNA uracil-C5-methylase (TrmA/RlmC/RlmD family)
VTDVAYQAGQVIEVTLGDAAHGGFCVARPEDGPVIFVRHGLPGERVSVQITDVTSRYARADAVEILDASADRVDPPCPHARPGGCGGCDWQHATLPAQRALKAAVVAQQLQRLAGLDYAVTVEPLPEEPGTGRADTGQQETGPHGTGQQETGQQETGQQETGLGWRTRMQFAVGKDGVAGLRGHRSHEVIDVGQCPIAHPAITELSLTRLRWPDTASVEAIAAPGSGERAVIVSPRGKRGPGGSIGVRSEIVDQVTAEVVLSRSGRSGAGLTGLRGHSYLSHHAAGREWRVSAGAFWQVHPAAADVLVTAVLAALEPRAGDSALDLYCGAGLFAGVLAPATGPGGTVAGVEFDPAAVRDARHNLREWPWARVHRGDVAEVIKRGALRPARLVVADPPRAGLAREVIEYLCADASGAERFAYVSCDPATLARDIGLLRAGGWELATLRAFDAFPMTHHVECVAVLEHSPRAE